MFRYERDMIPVLKEHLSIIFDTDDFVEEFSTGLGIADIVFTTKEVDFRDYMIDYESMYYIVNYFNALHSTINTTDIVSTQRLKRSKFDNVVRLLKDLNCLIDIKGEQFKINQLYNPCLYDLNSIEAKLGDWKKGFFQAMRYKQYSHKSFLAVSHEFTHRVDKNLLIDNNIGLISVYSTKIEIIINPIKEEPINKTAFYYLSESFAAKLKSQEMEYHYV